jgi:hypothetical protein
MDKKQEATAREGRDENKKEREKIRREKGKIRKNELSVFRNCKVEMNL